MAENPVKFFKKLVLGWCTSRCPLDVTFPEMYVMFSEQNVASLSENIIESVYENEIRGLTRNGSYMGIWLLFAATNILGHPIRSLFPLRGSESFRKDFNRMCLPADGWQQKSKNQSRRCKWSARFNIISWLDLREFFYWLFILRTSFSRCFANYVLKCITLWGFVSKKTKRLATFCQ